MAFYKQVNHGPYSYLGTEVTAQNKDFGAVSQTDLNRSVFPSVAQDSIKTDNGNDDSGDDSYGDSVGGGFWW